MFRRVLQASVLASVLALSLAGCNERRPTTTIDEPAAVAPAKINFAEIKVKGPFNPEEVVLFDNGQQRSMRYLTPQMRTAVRALGFGGVGQYAVLRGTRATLRVAGGQPVFLFAVPSNAQPESYFTLANFATRDNGTREVIVGGGYMSYSTGVNKDRVVPTTVAMLPDQSKAPKNYTLYAATVNAPLKAGEYAIIFYSSQVRGAAFAQVNGDSYFDFGID
ncbi:MULTISPECIES: hypothetical protein [Azospirillum]|uniref:DUF4397 domain-containing protein n=1 Tax=Azospirillum brasilense TaxID=192 RepID=A0ABU4P8E5_AZOBR|nr:MULTISPECIES: hypothetical protein [Azospirillum]ALJ35149.1 hypothetical protein AMK58_06760 [Azospirillum brasilense]MDW7594144.1 hypothetical protein [Azospirillum brasilense]MDX5953840.1 hypothetical protein [Azospirillum brasilense]OPH17082.1 hypothetical protein FE89_02025 [Azospirillum brasilense]OPH22387.1 hypothetical protein FE88_02070 [Azospirillum brasilense]